MGSYRIDWKRSAAKEPRIEDRAVLDRTNAWQLNTARQTSAAKGIMGVRPRLRKMYPD
jgi:hypothetical protein